MTSAFYREIFFHTQRPNVPMPTTSADDGTGNPAARYEVIKQLGKGSYGTVFLVKERARGKPFCMKKIAMQPAMSEKPSPRHPSSHVKWVGAAYVRAAAPRRQP